MAQVGRPLAGYWLLSLFNSDRIPAMKHRQTVAQRFNKIAESYDQASIIALETGRRLLDRLHYIKLQAGTILDLGCATGYCAEHLQAQFPDATVMGIDIAHNMLQQVTTARTCADAASLPIKSGTIDLVISNLLLPWCDDIGQVIGEIKRVLSPQGSFLLTTYGPDTLKELRTSWATVDQYTHTQDFYDMHDIGDALLQCGFTDPVVDMENITIRYRAVESLLKDLHESGSQNLSAKKRRTLTGRNHWQQFIKAYQDQADNEGRFPASYEIIYAHAWQSQPKQKQSADGSEISIPIESIGRR